jgi:hypothetical protein
MQGSWWKMLDQLEMGVFVDAEPQAAGEEENGDQSPGTGTGSGGFCRLDRQLISQFCSKNDFRSGLKHLNE